MYPHPYFSEQITAFEQEQIARAAERRLFLAEHSDQIVARPAGPLRRMLRRLAQTSRGAADERGTGNAAAANAVVASPPESRECGTVLVVCCEPAASAR